MKRLRRKAARLQRVLFFAALAIITGFFLSYTLGFFASTDNPVRSTGRPEIGGAFELVSHEGKTVTHTDFAGRYMLVFFGFTYCPDVCPTELQIISTALDHLGEKAKHIQPLFVSIDPERDTPAVLSEYVDYFNNDFMGLTGTPQQIAQAARAYKVYYAKVEDEDGSDYSMDHSSIIYFMGPDGEFETHFSPGTNPVDMSTRIAAILDARTP